MKADPTIMKVTLTIEETKDAESRTKEEGREKEIGGIKEEERTRREVDIG